MYREAKEAPTTKGQRAIQVCVLVAIALGVAYYGLRDAGPLAPEWFKALHADAPARPAPVRSTPVRDVYARPAPGPSHESLQSFKRWCLEDTAVLDVHIQSDDQFFVSLPGYKLTTKDNVKAIAQFLARAYCSQVRRNSAVCHVRWHDGSFVRGGYDKNLGAF